MATSGRPVVRGDLGERGVDPLLHLEPGVLDLQVDGLAPEDVGQPRDLGLGLAAVAVLERLADPAREAAGERDEALRVRGEQVPVDPRLVVVALEEARRGELDQVRVALVRLGEEREVGVALPLREPVVGDVDLAAEQRLDALLPGLPVELDRAGEAAVVGERDGRHLQLGSARRQLRDPAGPVEDRVLGVDVEVDELGHARWARLPSRSDGSAPVDPEQPERDEAEPEEPGDARRAHGRAVADDAEEDAHGDDGRHREERREPQAAPVGEAPEREREHAAER